MMAAVVVVFSFFLLLYLITGVTVTSMYVSICYTNVECDFVDTYFLNIKIRHIQYIDVMLT